LLRVFDPEQEAPGEHADQHGQSAQRGRHAGDEDRYGDEREPEGELCRMAENRCPATAAGRSRLGLSALTTSTGKRACRHHATPPLRSPVPSPIGLSAPRILSFAIKEIQEETSTT